MRKKPAAFPVGLYGMLLFALCWLTLPGVFAPLERVAVGAACAPVRLLAAFTGTPVSAASTHEPDALAPELAARIRAHGAPAAGDWIGDADPVHCAVVAVVSRKGGGGEPCELLLDHTYAELAGCRELVTKGDAFVGTLQTAGSGASADDTRDDFARVVLPNHAKARAMHAECATPDGGALRFVVRAAAAVDPAPLRVDLWDDPWRAARLDRPGLPVRTRALQTAGPHVPAGLLLGATRIWGYPNADGQGDLTLGVFVTPAIAPRALSHVVVWRVAGALPVRLDQPDAAPRRSVHRRAATLHELPGVRYGRYLLASPGVVVDGAAVVRAGYLVGSARSLAFGSALVTAFAASRQRWNLIALPDVATARPVEFLAQVDGRAGAEVVLVRRGDAGVVDRQRLGPGWLFTGSNGLHCPAGICIGRMVPHPHDAERVLVTVPEHHGTHVVEVLTPGDERP